MTIYDLLNIKPDAHIDEIRTAYQERLKEIDMLRHMEDYQKLRDAYNQAVKNYHNNQQIPINLEQDSIIEEIPNKQSIEIFPVEKSSTPSLENNWENSFSMFLNQFHFYTDFETWQHLLSPFLTDATKADMIKKEIESFLIDHYMLLQDDVRIKLINLLKIKESDFSTVEKQDLFNQQVKVKNFLDYSFYKTLPSTERNDYFYNRYLLFSYLTHSEKEKNLDKPFLTSLMELTFKDDDLRYLLGVYSLITPNFLENKETYKLFAAIENEKYQHDIKVFNNLLHLLEDSTAPMVSNIDIIGLSWVSDSTKEMLMSRLKEIRRHLVNTKQPSQRKRQVAPIPKTGYKPIEWWKLIAGAILFFTFISAVIGFVSYSDRSDQSFFDNFNDLTEFDEESFDFDEVEYKLTTRENHIKVNPTVYAWLFYDEELDTEYGAFSEKSIQSLDALKSTEQESLDPLLIVDMFEDIKEIHNLTEQDTVITYSEFNGNQDWYLKTVTNNQNEIINLEQVTLDESPFNSTLGTLDATLFFTNDLLSYGEDSNQYLSDLEKLYSDYLTDELYERLSQLTDEQFLTLIEFSYSKPVLLKNQTQPVILLTNFDNEYLFIGLNEEHKIESIYFEEYEKTPESFIKEADTLTNLMDTNNPWAYDLGATF